MLASLSSLSVGVAIETGVGSTAAALFVALLFVFFYLRRQRTAKKGRLNTAALQVGSNNGNLAPGQEYRKLF